MNYIAHIHIGNHTQTSLLGNFLGDFIKGNISDKLPQYLADGVRLHRKVDQFTDQHPLVKTLRQKFPHSLRRVSGIVIDIVFDHCLLQQWDSFTQQAEHQVLGLFYQQLSEFKGIEQAHFKRLSDSLVNDKWLSDYSDRVTCMRAFVSIERRLNNKILFAHDAYAFLKAEQQVFDTTFAAFYPALLDHAVHCKEQLISQHF
ncbi:ACP phosphodiesterase [Paraglaciecola sp.]|uniref:acyl carrier protein phosphodiesterase n=1 Tax=Paraglaciecola sp. TaxID=1920173 RepID=UPI0030F425DF